MDIRNCGECSACAEGDYDRCTFMEDNHRGETIYILESFDQWDEYNPWDLRGFLYNEQLAKDWVEEAKKYQGCHRRYREVKHKYSK